MYHCRCLRSVIRLILAFSMVAIVGHPVASQTDEPTAGDESVKDALDLELERKEKQKKIAEADKAIAEAKKAIAEAEQAELAAKLPDSDAEGLKGTVTLKDGAGYYAEILAYRALGQAAADAAADIAERAAGKKLMVTTAFDVSQQSALRNIIRVRVEDLSLRLDELITEYSDANGNFKLPAPAEIIGVLSTAIPAFVGAAADIASFFKIDREISPRAVKLSKRAMVADITRAIAANEKHKVNAILLPELNFRQPSPLATAIEGLLEKRRKAIGLRAGLKKHYKPELDLLKQKKAGLAKAKAVLAKDKTNQQLKAGVQSLEGEVASFEQARKEWQGLDTRFAALIDGAAAMVDAVTGRPKGAQSPLEVVAAVDLLHQHTDAMVLFIDIASQGAEIEVTKSVWGSGRISYIGGMVLTYILLDKNGGYVTSGTVKAHLAESFKGKRGPQRLGGTAEQ